MKWFKNTMTLVQFFTARVQSSSNVIMFCSIFALLMIVELKRKIPFEVERDCAIAHLLSVIRSALASG
jgi:hypothetical protein